MNSSPYTDLKIFRHLDKLNAIRDNKVIPPVYIRIKPTNKCDHHCYYCSYADTELNLRNAMNRDDFIPWSILRETINQCGEMKVKAITFSGGGESLVYPYINEAMQLVLDNKIDLSIITNGQKLYGKSALILSNAKWVRISMDSCNAEQFSKIRNIPKENFNKLTNNIKEFAIIKDKECEFGINFVVNHLNCDSIYDMTKLIKSLGVNHIKFAARITKDLEIYHSTFKQKAIDLIQKSKELESKDFKVIDKYSSHFDYSAKFYRTYTRCPIMQIVTVIAADSKIYPCHDKAYVLGAELGDLKKQTFRNIWYSLGDKFKSFNPMEECKHHCVYDSRNILINDYLGLDDNHINFI